LEAIKEAEEAALAEAEAAAAEAAAEAAMDLFGDDNEDDKVRKMPPFCIFLWQRQFFKTKNIIQGGGNGILSNHHSRSDIPSPAKGCCKYN